MTYSFGSTEGQAKDSRMAEDRQLSRFSRFGYAECASEYLTLQYGGIV